MTMGNFLIVQWLHIGYGYIKLNNNLNQNNILKKH